ncbi:MAG: hypothetical protein ACI8YC_001366 [Salibacteraceae bacterium]|jgi:hypothetical protein
MNQDDALYPDAQDTAYDEPKPSDKIEDLSDYEEALS